MELFEKTDAENIDLRRKWVYVLRRGLTRPDGPVDEATRIHLVRLVPYMERLPAGFDPQDARFEKCTLGPVPYYTVNGQRMEHRALLARKFSNTSPAQTVHHELRRLRTNLDSRILCAELPEEDWARIRAILGRLEEMHLTPGAPAQEVIEAYHLGRVSQILEHHGV